MRLAKVWIALVPALLPAAGLPIEKLFSRPFVWGTSPSQHVWSRKGHTLAFLWNEQGHRFVDLYAYHPDSRRRVRLTSLESFKDDLLLTAEEKDERRKQYLMPPAGLASFALSEDGAQAVFPFRDDLFLVPTSGDKPPFRLTRTKGRESDPQFSPDGKKLGSIRGGQVVVQDLGSGQIWQVTDLEAADGSLTSYRWSRDGRRIAYGVRKGEGRQMPLPNYSGQFVAAPTFSRSVAGDEPVESATFVIAAEGGKPVKMEPSSFGTKVYGGPIEWSPDSTKLRWGVSDAVQKKQQIIVWDAA